MKVKRVTYAENYKYSRENIYIPCVNKVIFMKHIYDDALNNQNEKVINQWKLCLPHFKIIYIHTLKKGFCCKIFNFLLKNIKDSL